MNRRSFLKTIGSAALLPMLPRRLWASTGVRRVRPGDAAWPSPMAWKQLDEAVGGNLIPVNFPLSILKTAPDSAEARQLLKDIKNPYYVGDTPGLTQTLGWVDAWATRPSVYAVAARSTRDIAAAVNFARENNLRLVVKGGGHSYQGTSNAPDSLLIWTRHMHDIEIHPGFVPQGCDRTMRPQAAVTFGAGTIGMQAYDAVTTKAGRPASTSKAADARPYASPASFKAAASPVSPSTTAPPRVACSKLKSSPPTARFGSRTHPPTPISSGHSRAEAAAPSAW
jgi:hypothetical protein